MFGIKLTKWPIEEMTGYKPKTTFWNDFEIAEAFGMAEVKDTYKRAFESWKEDVEYLTELVMVLNWRIHWWYGKNDDLAKLYDKLWREADAWCMKNLKDKDLSYFLKTTD